jgi:hypothetical protein
MLDKNLGWPIKFLHAVTPMAHKLKNTLLAFMSIKRATTNQPG